ncbi:MAG: alpha/beta hydrolase [Burkholderiales bacterium]|nr:alpha/beta hydrolase [Burkholderiales bacterium]
MFTGFRSEDVAGMGVPIRAVVGGKGPPLLLLHGHPQTHAMWHKVADRLAQEFTVVATDLRGYGDSGKPAGLPEHENYGKRVMAQDQVAAMRALGFDAFAVMAHDRGARAAMRMAVDHPGVVTRLVTLDVAPTLAMYEQTGFDFARAYWHWFFLVRPAPFPETAIRADPELYLAATMGARRAGLAPFAPEAYAEYLRCLRDPATAHGICEDYRAGIGIDLVHDRADRAAGRMIECETLSFWGADGVIGRCFDPATEMRRVARRWQGKSLPCGHYIAEEAPELLLAEALPFLK